MMRTANYKYAGLIGLMIATMSYAQKDTLTREVTVEKEFQPIIQSAGKLKVSPDRLSIEEPRVEIVYSEYSAEQGQSCYAEPMRFPSQPFPTIQVPDGLLEGGLGHVNSYFNFKYRVPVQGKASKGVKLDLYAHHDAIWGVKTWEKSTLGMKFVKEFSDFDVYLDVLGKNHFYTRYGRYFDGDNKLSISRYSDLKAPYDKQNIWTAAATVGIRSNPKSDIQYHAQTGYQAYAMPHMTSEHQIRTEGAVEWVSEEHHIGADVEVRNMFYAVEEGLWLGEDTALQTKSRHAIRIHPYYKYSGERVRVRAGVHLDMNIGKGQMLSSNGQISFAPSPDVELEYRIIPSWLAVYAGAVGQFGYGTTEEFVNNCPYRAISRSVYSQHVCGYTPVDAFFGFKIRATDNLLIDVYARYAYLKNQTVNYVDSTSILPYGNIKYFYSDYQRWKVGAEITYHYQDIIHILASGNYYHWTAEKVDSVMPNMDRNMVYDRPSWDARLRIDARIDKHWSLYSDNRFAGQFNALYMGQAVKGKALIDLSLGARYDFNETLGLYLQLNNYLNRHNDIYYTYQSDGIQGTIGVSWRF